MGIHFDNSSTNKKFWLKTLKEEVKRKMFREYELKNQCLSMFLRFSAQRAFQHWDAYCFREKSLKKEIADYICQINHYFAGLNELGHDRRKKTVLLICHVFF